MADSTIDLYPLNFLGFHDFDGSVTFWLDSKPGIVMTVAMTQVFLGEPSARVLFSEDGWHSPPPTATYTRLVILHEIPPPQPGQTALVDSYLTKPAITVHYSVTVTGGTGVQSYGQLAAAPGTLFVHKLAENKKAKLAATFKVQPHVPGMPLKPARAVKSGPRRKFPALKRAFVNVPLGVKKAAAVRSASVGDVVAITSPIGGVSLRDVVWTMQRSNMPAK